MKFDFPSWNELKNIYNFSLEKEYEYIHMSIYPHNEENVICCDLIKKSTNFLCNRLFFIELTYDSLQNDLLRLHNNLKAEALSEKQSMILDSGERREFESGAVRDISEGKGRCDLLPFGTLSKILKGEHQVTQDVVTMSSELFVHHIFEYMEIFKAIKNYEFLIEIVWMFVARYYSSFYEMIIDLSKHYEAGAKKYSDNNWKKGIPTHCFFDSATRHLMKFMSNHTDEPHNRAFLWNIIGLLWTLENKPELDDISN